MEAVAEHGISVVLSSHLVADLERVCDYLIVLVASRVRVAGEVSDAAGRRTTGCPGRAATPAPSPPARTSSRKATPTGRPPSWSAPTSRSTTPAWTVTPVSLEDLVLAYMSPANEIPARSRARSGVMIRLSWLQFRAQAVTAAAALAAARRRRWPHQPRTAA